MMSININKSTILILLMMCTILIVRVQSASINSTDESEDRAFKAASPVAEARTFGAIKRFQSALLPIMYKLGVMSAVIFMTLLLAFKSVLITKLILILNLIFFAIKFGALLKSDHGHQLIAHSGWSPPIHGGHGWAPHKDVHLHIHNGHGKPEYTIPYSTLSGGWDSQPHGSGVEPTWSSVGNNYVSGRGFGSSSMSGVGGGFGGNINVGSSDEITSYANAQQSIARNANLVGDKLNSFKPKIVEKRSDREPTIVMAQTNQPASPYNYMNTQHRQ